jgi:hypothetical protein
MPDCSETLCALRVRQALARIGYPIVARFGLTQVEIRPYSEKRNRVVDAESPQQIGRFQNGPSVGLIESGNA